MKLEDRNRLPRAEAFLFLNSKKGQDQKDQNDHYHHNILISTIFLYDNVESVAKISKGVGEMQRKLKNLTVQVIIGIILGIIVGFVFPEFGAKLKVLADGFIKLIKTGDRPDHFLHRRHRNRQYGRLEKRSAASAARRSFILKLSRRLRWRSGLSSSTLSNQGLGFIPMQ